MKALYDNNWIVRFNWAGWEEGQRIYRDSPNDLRHVDLETLRKLLTAHVRQDRFCEGHLLSVWESGHLLSILRRIREIRNGRT